MSLWSRLFRWRTDEKAEEVEPTQPATEDEPSKTIDLPVEPFVFECQSCGKVFEARRKRPQCPECDSTDVAMLSD